jgi:antitoxin component YwqK of YwqJK toxin-antitoxin module
MSTVRTKFEHVEFDKTANCLVRRYYTDSSKQVLFSKINTDYGWASLTKGELYHPNGTIKSTFSLNKNDEYHGRVNIYKDGNMVSTCTYVDGHRHGYEIVYYPNGSNVHTSIQYSYDVQDGPYTIMYPTGKIKEKGQFSKGHLVNMFVIRYDNLNNSIMIECEFSENGILKNEYKIFDENYVPVQIHYYNNGKCINKIELDHFKISDECQKIHDRIMLINEANLGSVCVSLDVNHMDQLKKCCLDFYTSETIAM